MKVELICFLYDKKLADMEIESEDIIAKITVDTDCIETVREVTDDGTTEISKGKCIVCLDSGETFEIGKSYADMVKLWKESDY